MFPGLTAQTDPDKLAVVMVDSGRTLTYRQLEDNSAALARVFFDAGLRRGDCVAVLTTNQLEVFEIYWATRRSGLYFTAVNSHLKAKEAAYIVKDSGAKALVVSADLSETAREMVDTDTTLKLAFGGVVDGFASYENAVGAAGERLSDQPCGAMMLYSSGTTGLPKGIKPPLPNRDVDEPGEPFYQLLTNVYGVSRDDVYLSLAPIYHAAPMGWTTGVQALGGTVVMVSKFEPERALEIIDKYRVTVTQMVPTMFVRILKLPDSVRSRYDTSSLRVVVHAAAPCPVEVKHEMMRWLGPVVYEYYAATESSGMTFVSPEEWLARPGTVGKSVLGILHICDEAGADLANGEIGTIYFERDTLPFVYHNDPEKTSAAQHPDHPTWTTTGDVGYVDDDGFLYLTDRKSFMIISGGVNIYPRESEEVLTLHPKVADVAVIGLPDPEMGEQVKAVVQLEPGIEPTEELAQELIDYTRSKIAHFKAPRSVDFVTELPRTPTGKMQKGKLREKYLSGAKSVS